ncbi:hypothetical protein HYX10_01540 [Candidatus Woesearchaeota archaeon]|nr:hypothetical protein [Candidatus Woesearchaeota archaeon]
MKKGLIVLLLFLIIIKTAAAEIQVSSPQFGIAQQLEFNLAITTAAAASCRYSTPFDKPYDEMSDFDVTGATGHTLDVTLPAYETYYNFFINCSSGQEYAKLLLRADSTAPIILSAKAEPDKVIQTPLQTLLKIVTSENSSCRYDETAEDYNQMANSIAADTDKSSYKTTHEKLLTGLQDNKDHALNAACRDLAGHKSTFAAVTFKVNTSEEPKILEVLPADSSYTAQVIVLKVTTNKNSICTYGQGAASESSGTFNVQGITHEASLQLADGTYTYNIKCIFEGPKEAAAQTAFTVDKSPPAMVSVNDSQELDDAPEQYTYYTDRLKAKWKAEDKESGIKNYNYSIVSGSKTILNWTTTASAEVTADGLKLEDGSRYLFRVKAQNNAGLWSQEKESDGVTVEASLNIELACKNGLQDGDESDVDCGGSCGKCDIEKKCESNEDCLHNFCFEGQCSAGSCSDGFQNQDETDADCGGICDACTAGSKCSQNADCETNYCAEKICISRGPCYNNELDSGETDVDCGGACTLKGNLCQRNKNCKSDEDCTSRTCGINRKCAATNDRDSDAVTDSADNCPGKYNPDQKDADNDGKGDACDDDSDNDGMNDAWESQYGLNTFFNDAQNDNDGDTLSNIREFQLGTNPTKIDSDGDGSSDALEVEKGTDPADPRSQPEGSRLVKIFLWLIGAAAVGSLIIYIYLRRMKAAAGIPEPEMPQPRKYRPAPNYAPVPPPVTVPGKNIDALKKEFSKLTGEELFRKLRRRTRGLK